MPAKAAAPPVLWKANPGPQEKFLASTANEVLFGGAASGGKSAASIAMPLRWIHNPKFRALFLRREAKYLTDAIDKSSALYPKLGGRFVQSPRAVWTFPSGAQLHMSHMEHEKDVANYDGFEFHCVILEELTHFTEKQYRGIRARIRGTDPTLPRISRATTNPGGQGHEWVFERFGPWLNPRHPNPAAPGEVRYFLGNEEVPRGTPDALSRQFIPSKITDNPHVTAEYRAQLLDLDPVRRAQLLEGDWLIKPAAGLYFQRGTFEVITALPKQRILFARYWDRAATVAGDWTVGAKLAKMPGGLYVVVDIVRFRGPPAVVEANIKATAALDGKACAQILEQDPGSAGVFERDYLVKALAGFTSAASSRRATRSPRPARSPRSAPRATSRSCIPTETHRRGPPRSSVRSKRSQMATTTTRWMRRQAASRGWLASTCPPVSLAGWTTAMTAAAWTVSFDPLWCKMQLSRKAASWLTGAAISSGILQTDIVSTPNPLPGCPTAASVAVATVAPRASSATSLQTLARWCATAA